MVEIYSWSQPRYPKLGFSVFDESSTLRVSRSNFLKIHYRWFVKVSVQRATFEDT